MAQTLKDPGHDARPAEAGPKDEEEDAGHGVSPVVKSAIDDWTFSLQVTGRFVVEDPEDCQGGDAHHQGYGGAYQVLAVEWHDDGHRHHCLALLSGLRGFQSFAHIEFYCHRAFSLYSLY